MMETESDFTARIRRLRRIHMCVFALVTVIFVVTGVAVHAGDFGRSSYVTPYTDPPLNYGQQEPTDAIADLQRRIERGEVALKWDEEHGYLRSLLELLEIPITSQTLVFSKTSFQNARITPATPRALYFNDEVYVGWVQRGDVIEVASTDRQQGTIFYTLNQSEPAGPVFTRTDQCLQCHADSRTMGVPGLLVRSVVPDEQGIPLLRAGTAVTDHRSMLSQRWGGWYVTGTHGEQLHMGNQVARVGRDEAVELDLELGANLTDLSQKINTDPYLGKHSDLVALMVLEHQTQMHNMITRVNYETRLALRDQAAVNRASDQPAGTTLASSDRRIDDAVEQLLRFMLFTEEEILEDPISGTSDFVKEFEARGPFDSQGRSLRKFGLRRWLFEYPCSFLIYSDSIKALPEPAKERFYRRLHAILTDVDRSETFRHVSRRDRKAIFEILLETHDDLPAYWREPDAQ